MNYYTPSLLLFPRIDVQGLLQRALAHTKEKVFGCSGKGASVLAALLAGDPGVHSAFRYALSKEFCRYLAEIGTSFRAFYIYGSTMENRAHLHSDVDVIILVYRKTDAIESLLWRAEALLAHVYRTLVGVNGPDRLLDLHLIDEEDMKKREHGGMIQSLWTAPVCIWHR